MLNLFFWVKNSIEWEKKCVKKILLENFGFEKRVKKIFWSIQFFVSKNSFWSTQFFMSKFFGGVKKIYWAEKKFWGESFFCWKIFHVKKIFWFKKTSWMKKFLSKHFCWVEIKFWAKKFWDLLGLTWGLVGCPPSQENIRVNGLNYLELYIFLSVKLVYKVWDL